MVKGIKFLVILIGLSSCMKLEDRTVLLDQHCLSCRPWLEDSLTHVRGIYWAKYDPKNASVHIKYDPNTFASEEFHELLSRGGFLQMGDSTMQLPLPQCCTKN